MAALAACAAPSLGTTPPGTATPIPLTATTTSPSAMLTCAYAFVPLPILQPRPTPVPIAGDEVELLCLVTEAPSTDTSFTLTLVITSLGPPNPPTPSPCVGTLEHDEGTCAHTYLVSIGPPPLTPIASNSQPFTSVVFGTLLPSGQRLGPVTPILATR
jgi:hypothetical protein